MVKKRFAMMMHEDEVSHGFCLSTPIGKENVKCKVHDATEVFLFHNSLFSWACLAINANVYKYGSIQPKELEELKQPYLVEMNCHGQLKPVAAMVAVNLGLAVVNVLIKQILNRGVNHLVIITYRQSIAAVFISAIAFFLERYVDVFSICSMSRVSYSFSQYIYIQ